jgi:hypothetical protein
MPSRWLTGRERIEIDQAVQRSLGSRTGPTGPQGERGPEGPQGPAGTGTSDTYPVIVGSFAAKMLNPTNPQTLAVLLASAPIGNYRITLSATKDFDGDDDTNFYPFVTFPSGGGVGKEYFTQTEAAIPNQDVPQTGDWTSGWCPTSGRLSFTTDSVGDISLCLGSGEFLGSLVGISVILELLPEPSNALYHLNAIPDASVDAGATVTLDPAGPTFVSGASVTATPTASSGYHFAAWTGDVASGHETDNPLTLTMDGPKSLTASFEAD